tara:strand:- start:195 stop:788 length:594 start_codon:yes stop_codon:yes gene_type:complete
MAKYEIIPTVEILAQQARLPGHTTLPELVHLDDPALTVMIDFKLFPAHTIGPEESIDNALNIMKIEGIHLLLVANPDDSIIGIVASEDILGEKPIKLLQERRIDRSQIQVHMIMTASSDVIAFEIDRVKEVKVGNIVNTLKAFHQHYALVIKTSEADGSQSIRGVFNTSQISKQLHMDIANNSTNFTVSELRKQFKD